MKWRELLELKLHASIARHIEGAGGALAAEHALRVDLGVGEDGGLHAGGEPIGANGAVTILVRSSTNACQMIGPTRAET